MHDTTPLLGLVAGGLVLVLAVVVQDGHVLHTTLPLETGPMRQETNLQQDRGSARCSPTRSRRQSGLALQSQCLSRGVRGMVKEIAPSTNVQCGL